MFTTTQKTKSNRIIGPSRSQLIMSKTMPTNNTISNSCSAKHYKGGVKVAMKFIPTLIKTFFLTFLVISSNINAGEFKKLYDYKMWEITVQPGTIPIGPQAFKQFGNLTHFSLNPNSYFVIDDEGNKETFNIDAFSLSSPTFINALGQDALKVQNGILLLDNPSTNPSFDNWIRNTDLPGFGPPSSSNWVTGIQTIYSEGEYYQFYSTSNSLFKLNNDMTELLGIGHLLLI